MIAVKWKTYLFYAFDSNCFNICEIYLTHDLCFLNVNLETGKIYIYLGFFRTDCSNMNYVGHTCLCLNAMALILIEIVINPILSSAFHKPAVFSQINILKCYIEFNTNIEVVTNKLILYCKYTSHISLIAVGNCDTML